MSTVELKNILKEKIDRLEEDSILKELLSIINFEEAKKEVFQIPEELEISLNKSLEQIDKGDTFTHEQVINELRDGLIS